MGIAACGWRGFKERTRVSGKRPIGAARCRQQYNQASCQTFPPNRLPLPPARPLQDLSFNLIDTETRGDGRIAFSHCWQPCAAHPRQPETWARNSYVRSRFGGRISCTLSC